MSTSTEIRRVEASEVRSVAVDFRGKLDVGELLIGTPTVVEVGSSDLTITNKTVNTGDRTINELVVPAGGAVLFRVAGFRAGARYKIKISIGSDATPAQTLVHNIWIRTDD